MGRELKKVFICHSSQDAESAKRICAYLEAGQIECWIAPRDVGLGEDYAEAIIQAIQRATVMLLVLSTGANQSRHVKNEIERAVSKGKIILPVRVEDVLPKGALELHVATCQWIDAFVPPLERGLSRLSDSILALIGESREKATGLPVGGLAQQPSMERQVDPSFGAVDVQTRGWATTAEGIVTGNRVSLRQRPTVAAKVIRELSQGDEVLVLDMITLRSDGECQLRDDITFKPEDGTPYRLRAGKGLLISGERDDSYRVEIRRTQGTDVGYVPKNAVNLLGSASWFKVRVGEIEGWVYSRYIRTF